jgi:hypothetical protein
MLRDFFPQFIPSKEELVCGSPISRLLLCRKVREFHNNLYLETGARIFLRNISSLLGDYTTSHPIHIHCCEDPESHKRQLTVISIDICTMKQDMGLTQHLSVDIMAVPCRRSVSSCMGSRCRVPFRGWTSSCCVHCKPSFTPHSSVAWLTLKWKTRNLKLKFLCLLSVKCVDLHWRLQEARRNKD